MLYIFTGLTSFFMKLILNFVRVLLFLLLIPIVCSLIFGASAVLNFFIIDKIFDLFSNLPWWGIVLLVILLGSLSLALINLIRVFFKQVVSFILLLIVRLCPFKRLARWWTIIFIVYSAGYIIYEFWDKFGFSSFKVGFFSVAIIGTSISLCYLLIGMVVLITDHDYELESRYQRKHYADNE